MPNPAESLSDGAAPFYWGVATSAYQIEGGTAVAGRAPSIWDAFSSRPGAIADGSSGEPACDHHRRWRDDVELLRWLGVNAYRLSISWPRVLPEGVGPTSARGLDFYDRLIDELMGAGITPFVTLYHWDLPLALEEQGGWRVRPTVEAFADFARVLGQSLGDRVGHWLTINEAWCAAYLGHESGVHAPGRVHPDEVLPVSHHLLLAHGLATQALLAERPAAQVGLAHMYVDCMPASESDEDVRAAHLLDGMFNRWYLDALAGRGYPSDMQEHFAARGWWHQGAFVGAGDLDTIATPSAFLGVNYYTRAIVRSELIPEERNAPRTIVAPPVDEQTAMGWEVFPEGLHRALRRIHRDYSPPLLFVTENGAAFDDELDAEGKVPDERRVRFLEEHLRALEAARQAGVPVGGYFVWSLLDNFEWAFGYSKRFGLFHVDFATQRRTPKASAEWYRARLRSARGGTS